MSLLNPNTSNFNVSFSSQFYVKDIDDKYDDFLKHLNSPIKEMATLITESIQSVSPPGFEYREITVENMGGLNGYDQVFTGTSNETQILDAPTLNITFRNDILNWSRMNEFADRYYARDRSVSKFNVTVVFMNSANIPMITYYYEGCYISGIPGLTFANNEEMNDAKTFDLKISFSRLSRKFFIPEFKKKNVTLKQN